MARIRESLWSALRLQSRAFSFSRNSKSYGSIDDFNLDREEEATSESMAKKCTIFRDGGRYIFKEEFHNHFQIKSWYVIQIQHTILG